MRYIVEEELWETITRRGIAGNLFMGVVSCLSSSLHHFVAGREG